MRTAFIDELTVIAEADPRIWLVTGDLGFSVLDGFAERFPDPASSNSDLAYRQARFYLMLSQTSCFRYWGEGTWADSGREFCRRAIQE